MQIITQFVLWYQIMLQEQMFSCFIWVSGLDNEILHRHKVAFSTKDAEVCKCLRRTIVQLRQLYLQIKKKQQMIKNVLIW